jgi:uncharacterized protein YciI
MIAHRLVRAALSAALFFASALVLAQSQQAPAAPAPEMTTYYMVFLLKGEAWTPGESPDHQKLQEQHLAHFRAMHDAGKLVIAGPFLDGQTIRGICVYKVASAEEAKVLAEGDPAVKAGRLKVEVHPWMVQKGILP